MASNSALVDAAQLNEQPGYGHPTALVRAGPTGPKSDRKRFLNDDTSETSPEGGDKNIKKQKTMNNTPKSIVIPDVGQFIKTKHVEHESIEGWVMVPITRAMQCPLCTTIVHTGKSEDSLVKLRTHMKQHQIHKMAFGMKCRKCKKEHPISYTHNGTHAGSKSWYPHHAKLCRNNYVPMTREEQTGEAMCTYCGSKYWNCKALQVHLDTCRTLRPAQREGPNIKKADKEKEKEPTVDTEDGFECLKLNLGTAAQLTSDVLNWALHKYPNSKVTILPSLLWSVLKTNDPNPGLLPDFDQNCEWVLLPICENEHWTLAAMQRKKGSFTNALYLDPFQPKENNHDITSILFEHFGVTWKHRPNYERLELPQQHPADNTNCGLYVIRYAASWSENEALLEDDPTVLRKYLKELKAEEIRIASLKPLMSLKYHPAPPLKPAARLRIPPPTNDALKGYAEQIHNWMREAISTYKAEGGAFNQLESITSHLATLIVHATRGRADKLNENLQYKCPPATTNFSTQTVTPMIRKTHIPEPPLIESFSLMKTYFKNRAEAFNNIIGATKDFCDIEPTALYAYFSDTYASATVEESFITKASRFLPKRNIPPQFCDPFNSNEMKELMDHLPATSAAGPDGLTFKDWRTVDAKGDLALWLCNECLHHCKIPALWKESKLILLFKKGDRQLPENWRPISLLRIFYKIFTGLWNIRINKIKNLLSPSQKGFTKHNGTSEHIALVREAIDHAKQHSKPIALAWLDLRNAFGSIPHCVITQCLSSMGFPDKFVNIVSDIYEGCTTRVATTKGYSEPVEIKCGTKQGDPISPILFNICLEILIILHEKKAKGFKLGNQSITLAAFADDLVIVERNAEELQQRITTMASLAEGLNLKFNPDKCSSLCLSDIGGKLTTDTIQIDGQDIPALSRDEQCKYLGCRIGRNNTVDITDLTRKIFKEGDQVANCALDVPKKLSLIRQFISSQPTYQFANSIPLTDNLRDLERDVARVIKTTVNLPKTAPNHYLYSPKAVGGLGFMPIIERAHILFLSSFLHRCWSKDKLTRKTTMEFFRKSIATFTGQLYASLEEACELLNTKSPPLCQLRKLPATTGRLWVILAHFAHGKDHLFSKFQLVAHNSEIRLVIQTTPKANEVIRTYLTKDSLTKNLCSTIQQQIYAQWSSRGSFTGAMAIVGRREESSWFIKDETCRLPYYTHRFIHMGRTGTTILSKDCRYYDTKKSGWVAPCKRCNSDAHTSNWVYKNDGGSKQGEESLIHVLNMCPVREKLHINRHDDIIRLLWEAVESVSTAKLTLLACDKMDRTPEIETMTGGKEPDLIIQVTSPRATSPTKILIIDITCPFEANINSFKAAEERKLVKYDHIVRNYNKKPNTTSACMAFIVGSLGGWYHECNQKVFHELGIPAVHRKLIAETMIASNINWSSHIYYSYTDGNNARCPAPEPLSLRELGKPTTSAN